VERRNRSLRALKELTYIDSLDAYEKAPLLLKWSNSYLEEDISKSFDLDMINLKRLSELFYKNINFLYAHRIEIKQQIDSGQNIKKFFL